MTLIHRRVCLSSGPKHENTTPGFVAVDRGETHWVSKVKMDKDMASAEVQGKREAARRWANYVSGDDKVGACWPCLLVSETDVENAAG